MASRILLAQYLLLRPGVQTALSEAEDTGADVSPQPPGAGHLTSGEKILKVTIFLRNHGTSPEADPGAARRHLPPAPGCCQEWSQGKGNILFKIEIYN